MPDDVLDRADAVSAKHRRERRYKDDPESPCLYCGANYFEECRPTDDTDMEEPTPGRVGEEQP